MCTYDQELAEKGCDGEARQQAVAHKTAPGNECSPYGLQYARCARAATRASVVKDQVDNHQQHDWYSEEPAQKVLTHHFLLDVQCLRSVSIGPCNASSRYRRAGALARQLAPTSLRIGPGAG